MSSLEDWCLDRSATEAEVPRRRVELALWVKSPVHHAPMLARVKSAIAHVRPGGVEPP